MQNRRQVLRRCVFIVNGEPPAEMKDFSRPSWGRTERHRTGTRPGRLSGDAAYGQRGAVWPAAPVRRRMGYAKPGDSKPCIPALLLLCGLIGFRPAASVAGLFLVGGPFLLAAVLIKRDGFAHRRR